MSNSRIPVLQKMSVSFTGLLLYMLIKFNVAANQDSKPTLSSHLVTHNVSSVGSRQKDDGDLEVQ